MSNECRRCARPTDAYICGHCVKGLREQLHDLPWWLSRLAETALGQVRLGDGSTVRTRRKDEGLTRYADETKTDHGTTLGDDHLDADIAGGKLAVDKVLALAGINTRAEDLHTQAHAMLGWWVATACEQRGIEHPWLNTASARARWLERHVTAIAGNDDAERCCEDVDHLTRAIERMVNRPVAPIPIGPCDADAPDGVLERRRESGDYETQCGLALKARKGVRTVTCPQCATEHNVEVVINRVMAQQHDRLFTIRELIDLVLPRLDRAVKQTTLERWINRGLVPMRGADDRGAQMVRLGDVLEVCDNPPKRGPKKAR